MARPRDLSVVDLMIGIPRGNPQGSSEEFGASLKGHYEDRRRFKHPAGYMFKEVPEVAPADWETTVLREMDRFNIEIGLVPVSFGEPIGRALVAEHPARFVGAYMVDPNRGMESVQELERAVKELGAVAAAAFPAGYFPQVPIDDRKMYPVYAKCVELDIPICVNAGVPGPRFPMDCQRVDRLDEVCWFFPDLQIVMRHGGEPWTELAVKLLLKWPNLYYSTSAFSPRYYPKDIIHFANTRGAEKVMYAGYFPSGLSLERIFGELDDVPFREHVWPKFLSENARRVFKLASR